MTQSLYRKWRPRRWDAVIGQEHVVQTLRNAVAQEHLAHAYLFAGPRGTGKTTAARLLAKAANCLHADLAERPCDQCEYCQSVNAGRFLDLIEIDAASNTSVEDVRDLRDKINFSPNQGRYKVYVVDEVHMLSTAAFNALLKTLEEPPGHAIFILATTEVHKIPATVLSRCQRHEFRRIPVRDISTHLATIAAGENLHVEPDALTLLARQSTGSLRDAISLLDQLASTGQPITVELAQSILGTAGGAAISEVVTGLIARDPAAGLDRIHQALDAGSDPRQFARQVVEYLRGLLLIKTDNAGQVDAAAEARALMSRQALALPTADLLRSIRAFNRAAGEARVAWQPSLPLELAYLESITEAPAETEPGASHSPASTAAGVSQRAGARPSQPPRELSQLASDAAPPSSRPPISGPPASGTPASGTAPAHSATPESAEDQALNKGWPQVLALVRKQNPNAYGLLNSCRSRHLSGSVLELGFASDVLKNQMAKNENLVLVQGALQQVLGRSIVVRCVINTAKRTEIPADVDGDGMVASALRDLGGEIVDIQ